MDLFIQNRNRTSLKFTGELCVMAKKNDAKFEEELTGQFKISMSNLTNGLLLTKVYNVWANESTEELCLMALRIDAKSEWKLTCAFKSDMKNLENFLLQAEK